MSQAKKQAIANSIRIRYYQRKKQPNAWYDSKMNQPDKTWTSRRGLVSNIQSHYAQHSNRFPNTQHSHLIPRRSNEYSLQRVAKWREQSANGLQLPENVEGRHKYIFEYIEDKAPGSSASRPHHPVMNVHPPDMNGQPPRFVQPLTRQDDDDGDGHDGDGHDGDGHDGDDRRGRSRRKNNTNRDPSQRGSENRTTPLRKSPRRKQPSETSEASTPVSSGAHTLKRKILQDSAEKQQTAKHPKVQPEATAGSSHQDEPIASSSRTAEESTKKTQLSKADTFILQAEDSERPRELRKQTARKQTSIPPVSNPSKSRTMQIYDEERGFNFQNLQLQRIIRPLGLNYLDCGSLVGEVNPSRSVFWDDNFDTTSLVDSYTKEGRALEERKQPFLFEEFEVELVHPDNTETEDITVSTIDVSPYGILKMVQDYYYLPNILAQQADAIIAGMRSLCEVYYILEEEFRFVFYPNRSVYAYILGLSQFIVDLLSKPDELAPMLPSSSFVKLLKHYSLTWKEEIPNLKHQSSVEFLGEFIPVYFPLGINDDDEDVDEISIDAPALAVVLSVKNYDSSSDYAKTLADDILCCPRKEDALESLEKMMKVQWNSYTPEYAVTSLVRRLST
jgi:tRNA(Leu) C34 or U34 (ribose-2'-O)-methylase TrmL